MKIWNKIILLLLLLAAAIPSSAQTQSFSLEDCISYGLTHNKSLQNARFDEYISEKKVQQVIAQGLPQINAQASGQWNYKIQSFLIVIADEPTLAEVGLPIGATVGASINQLLFDGTFFLGLKAARTYTELAKKQKYLTAEGIVVQVSKAFYASLITEQSMDILDANIARLSKLHADTKAMFEEGFVEKIDAERLEISLTNLQAERAKMLRMAKLSRDMLKFQMGMDVNESLDLLSPEYADNQSVVDGSQAFDFSKRAEYSLLKTQLDLENYNKKRFKVGYLPSLYFFGNYAWTYASGNGSSLNYDAGALGLQLQLPIFDGFLKKNQIQESELEIRKIENQRSMLENSINLELRNTQAQLENAKSNLSIYQKNRDLAQKVFMITQIKYNEGVGSSLEVNTADSELKQAETTLLNAQFEYHTALIDYKKARGEYAKYRIE